MLCKKIIILVLVAAVLMASMAGAADISASKGIFAKGKFNGRLVGGFGSSYGSDYFILGAGLNYNILDGLYAGLDFETWLGGTPSINNLSPSIGYVFWQVEKVKPYLAGFYRKTWVGGDWSDLEHLGARFGVYFASGRTWIGIGGVYEYLLTDGVYAEQSNVYPQVSVVVGF